MFIRRSQRNTVCAVRNSRTQPEGTVVLSKRCLHVLETAEYVLASLMQGVHAL